MRNVVQGRPVIPAAFVVLLMALMCTSTLPSTAQTSTSSSTRAPEGATAVPPPAIDAVRVVKAERRLELLAEGKVVRRYAVVLGQDPIGHKQQEGDSRTPEGTYMLDWRNPDSSYYKSIHISYPNGADRAAARALGVNPGGLIMIHGQPNNWAVPAGIMQQFDWTDGCIAVTNDEMDEIWALVSNGTPIEILP